MFSLLEIALQKCLSGALSRDGTGLFVCRDHKILRGRAGIIRPRVLPAFSPSPRSSRATRMRGWHFPDHALALSRGRKAQAMTAGFGRLVTALRVAAAALFAAFNLAPLYGIYAWGWDAFQLLLLYWAETVILFVCTLAHIACILPQQLGTMIVNNRSVPATRAMMVGFFALHGGLFITVHLVFLCVLFSGVEFSRLNGVADFVGTYFIAAGALAPLILVALAGAADVLTGPYHPAFVDAFARRLHIVLTRAVATAGTPPP